MIINNFSLVFILSVLLTIASCDILQLLAGTSTTTRKPTVGVNCFKSYNALKNDYTEFSVTKKYFISKRRSSWINAGAVCRNSGLRFVTLETQEEQTKFLDNLEKTNQKLLSEYILIGGSKRRKRNTPNEFEWVWTQTGKLIGISLDWAPGQPNNAGERCLGVSKITGTWKMHDIPCENFRGKFYCEK